jgi:NADH-quinone oxidoreductase subunit G
MPTIIVDGKSYEVDANDNLLEALLGLGLDLPYFCWHPSMGSIGSCRQCAVIQYRDEDDDKGRLVMSCMTPVTDGALLSIDAEPAVEFRSSVIENLMTNHPHDCPVCEEGGECHLQDMTVMAGHSVRHYKGLKTTHRNQYLGPHLNHEMNRCIACYRCVRYYRDYAGGTDLAAFGSRGRVYFGRAEEGVLENEFAGNLVEVCPTGVFTDKTLSEHYTRKWDLQSAPSICTGCSMGCNISVSERYGELRRIHNRYNSAINGHFLCDRGRFGGGFVNHEDRIRSCGVRNPSGVYDPVRKAQMLVKVAGLISAGSKIVGIGSPRASLESNHLLGKLVGEENFYSGLSGQEQSILNAIYAIQQTGGSRTPTLREVEAADAVLILGEDVTNTSARLALSLRQMVRNRSKEMANQTQIPLWHDAAVRKLAQNEKSPLVLLTASEDRLEDVSCLTHHVGPDDTARLGHAIANLIDARYSKPTDLTESEQALAANIAGILKSAEKPLIISGSGSLSVPVVEAAANVAWALKGENKDSGLIYCVPESNSLGATMLQDGISNSQDLDSLLAASGEIDVAIVLENDLYRRAGSNAIDSWLGKVKNLVVIDQLDNPTTSVSDLIMPAASFAETEGTLVNYEGRAQRSFAAFLPEGDIQGSWQWLLDIADQLGLTEFASITRFDQITQDLSAHNEALSGITEAAPDASYRSGAGQKVARMTHRASGRTAMVANVTMHEPRQPIDNTSALAFTMEGANLTKPGEVPDSLKPHIWSPGWNSNQAINKFQTETGGAGTDNAAGVRLIAPIAPAADLQARFTTIPAKAAQQGSALQLVPGYHLFGSEELSAYSNSIAQLAPRGYFAVHPDVAGQLGVTDQDGLEVQIQGSSIQLEVVVSDSVARECVVYSYGIDGAGELVNEKSGTFKKAEGWESSKPSNLIKSDR